MIVIKNRLIDEIILESKEKTIKEAIIKSLENYGTIELEYVELRHTDLRYIELKHVNLRAADLIGADLRGANIENTTLKEAELKNANLERADLINTDLRHASLVRASLIDADLEGSNLEGADLEGADLRDASLKNANLKAAYFFNADLRRTNLEVKHPPVNSHQFISEILRREAITENQQDLAARIRLDTNNCWPYFIALAKKKRVLKWAKEVLFRWDEFVRKFEEENE